MVDRWKLYYDELVRVASGDWVKYEDYAELERKLDAIRKVVSEIDEDGYIDEGMHDIDDPESFVGRIKEALK